MALGVPILKHFRVVSLKDQTSPCSELRERFKAEREV